MCYFFTQKASSWGRGELCCECCSKGSASSVRYCVYKLYIMYINWDVSLYKLMVYSLQIKLFPPSVLESSLSTSYMLGASLQVTPHMS